MPSVAVAVGHEPIGDAEDEGAQALMREAHLVRADEDERALETQLS